MNSTDALTIFLDIMKAVLPAVLVIIVAYSMLSKFINSGLEKMRMEQRFKTSSSVVPIKLQAYERLVLFLERNSLQALIREHNSPNVSATALRSLMISVLNQEYNHNLSQQIYVSSQAWSMLKVVKEEIIVFINNAYNGLKENATGVDLSKAILDLLMEREYEPSQKAIAFLKEEVKIIFG